MLQKSKRCYLKPVFNSASETVEAAAAAYAAVTAATEGVQKVSASLVPLAFSGKRKRVMLSLEITPVGEFTPAGCVLTDLGGFLLLTGWYATEVPPNFRRKS